jgi:secondary thiamine-phosphate synthase enzyme
MQQRQGALTVRTRGRGLYEITGEIRAWLSSQGAAVGMATLFCQHTSASLTIQENADPDVQRDIETFFERLVRDDPALYRHRAEGADDMPAHIRAALTDAQLSIPVQGGRMALGTWQGVYLFEHRTSPHHRQVVLHFIGDLRDERSGA